MKSMSLGKIRNLLFKQTNSGKQLPKLLFVLLAVGLVSGVYFLMAQNSEKLKQVKEIKTNVEAVSQDEILSLNIQKADVSKSDFDDMKTFLRLEKTRDNPLIRQNQQTVKLPSSRRQAGSAVVFDDTDKVSSSQVVPLGSMVKCLLISQIVTNNFDTPVVVQVWQDFYFNNKLLLPFGTRIYGTASAGKQRDRVLVNFHSIVFQDGRTVDITGFGLSKNASGGFTGVVVDERNKKLVAEIAVSLLAALPTALQDTYQNSSGDKQAEATLKNAVLEGVGNSLQKEAQRIQEEILKAEGYAVVFPGTAVLVYFEQQADVNPI